MWYSKVRFISLQLSETYWCKQRCCTQQDIRSPHHPTETVGDLWTAWDRMVIIQVLCLNSFKQVGGKLHKQTAYISYPDQLSWNDVSLKHVKGIYQSGSYCTHVFLLQSQRYQLRGFICHEGGTLQGGHYTACVRKSNAWYKMDDYKVCKLL